MNIYYLGHSCFLITTDGGLTVLTDPYTKVGYELPQGLQADIVTVSHGHFDHAFTQAVQAKKIVTTTEEYREGEVRIWGVESYHDPKHGALRGGNIIFKIQIGDTLLCHMGDIGEECSPAFAEKIGKVDVLLIPVGGTYTVDAIAAKKYVEALSPRVVIPMHYRPSDGTLDITDCQPFLRLFGKNVQHVQGEIRLDTDTQGVIYMERK